MHSKASQESVNILVPHSNKHTSRPSVSICYNFDAWGQIELTAMMDREEVTAALEINLNSSENEAVVRWSHNVPHTALKCTDRFRFIET